MEVGVFTYPPNEENILHPAEGMFLPPFYYLGYDLPFKQGKAEKFFLSCSIQVYFWCYQGVISRFLPG